MYLLTVEIGDLIIPVGGNKRIELPLPCIIVQHFQSLACTQIVHSYTTKINKLYKKKKKKTKGKERGKRKRDLYVLFLDGPT